MAIQKYGTQEPITHPDDTALEEIRKEASRAWTPEDSAQLVQENSDLSSEDSDRS